MRILAIARAKTGGAASFADVVQALAAAVADVIPSGRIYLLGSRDGAPIVGSIISGVGIVDGARGIEIVRRGVIVGSFA